MRRIALIPLICVVAAPLLAGDGKRSADEIVAEYDSIKLANGGPQTPQSAEARAAHEKEVLAALKRKAALALELYNADPNHARLEKLLPERWSLLCNRFGEAATARSETGAFLEAHPDHALATEAHFWHALATAMATQCQPEATLAAVNRFTERAPKDERGAGLQVYVAEALPAEEAPRAVALLKRAVEAFPDSKQAQGWRVKLRHLEAVGKPFELSFTDAIRGESISMKALRGKVVVVDFWATWCGPCVKEIPHLKELYEKYRGRGFEIIGVSLDKPEAEGGLTKLKDYIEKNQLGWLHYYQGAGWQSEFSRSWSINGIPKMFLVDADGNLYTPNARGRLDELIPRLLDQRDGKAASAADRAKGESKHGG